MRQKKYPTWKISLIVSVLALITFAAMGLKHVNFSKSVISTAKQNIAAQVREASTEIDRSVNTLVPINISISEDLTSGKLPFDEDAITKRLRSIKAEHQQVFGVGVAFVPGHFPNRHMYAPLYVNRENGQKMVQIEDVYDYTEKSRHWYHRPLTEGPVWQEPHYGQASQAFIANFTAPFFDNTNRDPIGVVFTSMSLDQYQSMVGAQGFGATGFGFLLSGKGAFVSHPDDAYVTEEKTISNWVDEAPSEDLNEMAASALVGRRSFSERVDPSTGKSQWVFIEPIISTGWLLGVVYETHHIEALASVDASLFKVQLSAGFLLLSLLSFFFTRPRKTPIVIQEAKAA